MRLETGVPGLDAITRGGLISGGIYLVVGRPGVGKSILGNQIAYAHVKRGGRAVYATLLSETHARMLGQMRELAFFDDKVVGAELVYLNALAALEAGGLDALLRSLQNMVREQKAELLVLDGLLPPSQLGVDELVYKKFVASLQTWVGMIGCTVIVLRTGSADSSALAEQTMVDGILELALERHGMGSVRRLGFTKLRGTGFAEGRHAYVINGRGLEVYPRIEASDAPRALHQPFGEKLATGTPGLDALVDGGFVRGSTTLFLGWTGAGKTVATLQFLYEGARAGEPVLHVGFFEPPHALKAKAKRLGMDLEPFVANGSFGIQWCDPTDVILDRVAERILEEVRVRGVRRLTIDGFAGLRTSDCPDRITSAFGVVMQELAGLGVTTVVTDELRELSPRRVETPTENASALFHNLVFLRQLESEARLLLLASVVKTRDSHHDDRVHELAIDEHGLRVVGPFRARGETHLSAEE